MSDTLPEPTHTIDVPLARKVLEFLESNADLHRQRAWATRVDISYDEGHKIDVSEQLPLGECGTAGCFAGWTVALAGHTVGTSGELAGVVIDLSDLTVHQESNGEFYIDYENSTVVAASEYARKALGLTEDQSNDLFAGPNSIHDLRHMLSVWTDGEIDTVRPE